MQRIRVSANRRHFTTENGDAFFWQGDTAWELFHKLSLGDACHYLDVRASQGFNVIQAVVLAELDGIHSPNANGDLPLMDEDPEQPNETYFMHVDKVIAAAAARGLYTGLLPTWGDKVNKRYDWAAGPELFSEQNAYSYGRWLARRWADLDTIIWILGGDRDPDDPAKAIWRAMAKGIRSADHAAVVTFHPQPFGGRSSSTWFHDEDWLSFNMLQTGHDRHAPVADLIAADHARTPVKPVLNGEPIYEAHPLSFKVSNGYSCDTDTRRDAYMSVFAGACGHTYGCHSVWQFHTKDEKGVNHPIFGWREALHLAGAYQMEHLHRLMLSRSPQKRIPGSDLLDTGHTGDIIAARADDGSYAFVYTATGEKIVIRTALLSGTSLKICWMSPKDGAITLPLNITRTPKVELVPPSNGEGCDWVLIIDAI